MEGLDRIAQYNREMESRPLCTKCVESRVTPPETVCAWCNRKVAKRRDSWERFKETLKGRDEL